MPRPPGQRSDNPIKIAWEAPPERERISIYDEVVEEVKRNPGRWARIRIFQTQSPAYNSKKALGRSLTEERWEIKVGRIRGENGVADSYGLYLRYRTPEQLTAVKR